MKNLFKNSFKGLFKEKIINIYEIFLDIFIIPKEECILNEIYLNKTQHYKEELVELWLDSVYICLEYENNLKKLLKSYKFEYNKSLFREFIKYLNNYWDILINELINIDKTIIWLTPINSENLNIDKLDNIDVINSKRLNSENLCLINLNKDKLDKDNLSEENIIIIWVPLNFLNYLKRWYNQTYLLSDSFAKNFSLRFEKILYKKRNIKQQSLLNRKDRLNNVEWAFLIKKKFQNKLFWKTIILIDDVISSWSTSNEIAKILKQNWAEKVIWLFLASGQ